MKRKRGCALVVLGVLVVAGLVFFITASVVTEQRRSNALANFPKPEAVKRYDRLMGESEVRTSETGGSQSIQPSIDADDAAARAGDRYAAYDQLFAQIDQLWEDLEATGWSDRDIELEERWEQLDELARKYPALIDAIRKAALLGGPVQPLDFSKIHWASPEPEHHLLLIRCADLLAADVRLKGESGDLADALASIEAGLRLSDALAQEPLQDSQYAAHIMSFMMSRAFQNAMDGGALTSDQAATLLDRLDQSRHKEACLETIQTSHYMAMEMLTDLNELGAHEFLTKYMEGDKDEVGTNFSVWVLGSSVLRPLVNRNVTILAESAGRAEELARMPLSEALADDERMREQLREPSLIAQATHGFGQMQFWRSYASLEIQAEHEAQLDLMRLGIAVQQYHAQHGVYPDTLDAVASRFGAGLPVDPFSGEAFRYRPDAGGFLLYSLGRDGKDDGGNDDRYPTDIVWRGRN